MKLSYPVQQTYVVLQLDPVAMVQHLNDPAALEEARSMTPKKYLVYISMVYTSLSLLAILSLNNVAW